MVYQEYGPEDLSAIVGQGWADEVRAAPREYFIPDRAQATPMSDALSHWIDRAEDPDRWRAAVYSDTTILTQVDDGATELTEETATRKIPSSSSTAPSLVGDFLDLLDPRPGDRVLEIGAGTGWTAALLSARLGDQAVTTVEVDEQVAKRAEENLRRAGFAPRVVIGDGALGHPDGAPYDRVHVTCGISTVPYAWVEQTRPGGVIALPWLPNSVRGQQLVLTVSDGQAVGRFHGRASFMMMRAQRGELPPPVDEPRYSSTRVEPSRIFEAGPGFTAALSVLLPGVLLTNWEWGEDRGTLRDPASVSYASASGTGLGGSAEAMQVGPRDLWSELEDAYRTWLKWGSPGVERLGVTVDRTGQHVWVDSSENRIAEGTEGPWDNTARK
ncbi:methyltransferase domain-containing protein [Nocardiopsis sp. NPDC049922]|uniref:methyltransferase domain-containing protein n=1 Tax=Nocardiopsis sp. NPDC049922 TaxID=3155157 RepID=UPI0033FF6D65